MPRKDCHIIGCKCTSGLTQVQPTQSELCAAILSAQGVEHGWTMKNTPEDRGTPTRSYLCENHYPVVLKESLQGTKVARLRPSSGELQFGAVGSVVGLQRDMRGQTKQVLRMLARPVEEWSYVVDWPTESTEMNVSQIRVAAEWAEAIELWQAGEALKRAEMERREARASAERARRAGVMTSTRERLIRTDVRLITFPGVSGLWHSLPARIQQMLPIRTYNYSFDMNASQHIQEMVIDTPSGTIHHSGGGLVFDIRQQNEEQGFSAPPFSVLQNSIRDGAPFDGLSWENWGAQYFCDRPTLCRHLFGVHSFDELEHFLRTTWQLEPDECGVACPRTYTAMQEFSLALWRMRTRESRTFLSYFSGTSDASVSRVMQEWIPRCGRVGRSFVWLPSMDYIASTVPESFASAGMSSVALIGDCTDILTQTCRKQISIRNQQHSDKSKHSAAMGLTWCTPSGWTAIASDLAVLGRTSEYNAAVALSPQFARIKG
mmetsp:Transcript_5419/g.13294  ORF Transcript_5419/g.13294 Transcript_5419/m.13294 type:complete len:489 (+) Transcript_5419:126-1592(+)